MRLTILLFLCLFSTNAFAEKVYPLIESISVTKKSITVIPGKHFRKNHLRGNRHQVIYNAPGLDLRKYDSSILIMPYLFDVFASILISNETYVVESLDTGIRDSFERLRQAFKIMYPNSCWEGKLISETEIEHTYQFEQNRRLTLFSGGVDSTYSLLSNLDKSQILLTQRGHFDSNTNDQWRETFKLAKRASKRFQTNQTLVFSHGTHLVDRAGEQAKSPDIIDWGLQAIGDLRWMGKAIPLMIHYKIPTLCIPSSNSWDYPIKSMTNGVIKKAFCFGNSLRVYTDGFDVTRTQKTKFIADFVQLTLPQKRWKLKVCFDKSGENCNQCRKCLRTINDLYIAGADPNLFGFATTEEETQKNVLKCLEELEHESQIHREVEAYFFNGMLKSIEQTDAAAQNSHAKWLYELLLPTPMIVDIRRRCDSYYGELARAFDDAWDRLDSSSPQRQ